jgi:hypothetical protein
VVLPFSAAFMKETILMTDVTLKNRNRKHSADLLIIALCLVAGFGLMMIFQIDTESLPILVSTLLGAIVAGFAILPNIFLERGYLLQPRFYLFNPRRPRREIAGRRRRFFLQILVAVNAIFL